MISVYTSLALNTDFSLFIQKIGMASSKHFVSCDIYFSNPPPRYSHAWWIHRCSSCSVVRFWGIYMPNLMCSVMNRFTSRRTHALPVLISAQYIMYFTTMLPCFKYSILLTFMFITDKIRAFWNLKTYLEWSHNPIDATSHCRVRQDLRFICLGPRT